ncbi:MAG: hypothetical protein ACK4RK_10565 [Gemmataceae bacterium]
MTEHSSQPAQPHPVDSGSDRRQTPRVTWRRPLLAIPMLPDGRPDPKRQLTGLTTDVSAGGMGLQVEEMDRLPTADLVVGVESADGQRQFAGLAVRNKERLAADGVRIGGQFEGLGQVLLRDDVLAPNFMPESLSFGTPFPEEVLDAWCELGVLQPALLDRVQLCPRCQGLPTFRPGCRHCGSAHVSNDRLIHHFACAHVGPVGDFETPAGLVCPKCRTRHLVVGSDFEYLAGPYRCLHCQWSDTELASIAQCLRCGFRCLAQQTRLQDLRGYRVHRLDPLAIAAPSRTAASAALGATAGGRSALRS